MSLRKNIEQIFEDNTNYKKPSQAVNQASSLNSLSSDLYTDSKRFIYELLQNADDSPLNNTLVKVWIKTFNDNLVIAHSGNPFTERDLQGICNINNGTKKSDSTKIGYKGIGFKSVFGQSEKVIVFTNNEYFRFDSSYSHRWKWEKTQIEWEKESDRKFEFPWQIIPIYTEIKDISEPIHKFIKDIGANVATIIKLKNIGETTQSIRDLSQRLNMFLFLKNISEIYIDVSELISININRTEKDRIILKKNSVLESEWLINTVSIIIPDNVRRLLIDERNIPDKLLNAESIELTLASKVENDSIIRLSAQEKLLYSYLPTDETKYSLPVLVNTSFLTSANRESLHTDSKWNQWLFRTIAIEIFKWISKLVNTEFQFQAYQLIPEEAFANDLGREFNEGIKNALKNIPFVISREDQLLKIEDTIIDFTFLSEKRFVGELPIKNFINEEKVTFLDKFAKNTGFGAKFKKLGAICFEWKDLYPFLSSTSFTSTHTISSNIELIKHLKLLSVSEEIKEISIETLRKLPFIWDHKNCIRTPVQVCIPSADDQNWDNQGSDLSFLHQRLQDWLHEEPDMREWLETLGMTEKTDITYITQTILPHIESYISHENANKAIQDLFILYRKGDLKEDLIKQLSRIKLLTQKGSLFSAKDCFVSNFYFPRLELEDVLESDIFIDKSYCSNTLDKDEWKRFFKMLGVQEGISIISFPEKTTKTTFISNGYEIDYFEADDKKFKPAFSTFTPTDFRNISTLSYIQFTKDNPKFAFRFWKDFLLNFSPEDINSPAIAYWGNHGMAGQIVGDEVSNYIPWYIKNIKCIPTVNGQCEISSSVLLNCEENTSIAGNYLPVFDGIELSQNWRAFFNFKTSLQLCDYLDLLNKIASDINEKGKIKQDNINRVYSIYNNLLESCLNWGDPDIAIVKEWANSGCLLNTKQQFNECNTLKYFLDGNESVFQDQFSFIALSAENKRHPNLECFLNSFKIEILRQSDFDLGYSKRQECNDLINHLKAIAPYFKIWIEYEINDERTKEDLDNLIPKIDKLNIYQTEELKIRYEDIGFVKDINVHFYETDLYVTTPWNTNSVLLKLPEVLCRYFYLLGHDKKLDFLLRSSLHEIQEYFLQENINIPEEMIIDNTSEININSLSFAEIEEAIEKRNISPSFFHMSRSDYEKRKYVEGLISRSVSNVIAHLNTLYGYDCTNHFQIASSIIGGITKNGNEITVVARPSDNDEVLVYYTSEFDVLEYTDAEFWCEDGINLPKQITFGYLLKSTGINKIPIKNRSITDSDIETLLDNTKSNTFDFNAIPSDPYTVAKIISSFANTNGGTLIFGLKELNSISNEVVGLSSDFRVIEITKKAISLLSPTPSITHDWMKIEEKSIFVIKTEKSDSDILLGNEKYIRKESNSILETENSKQKIILNNPTFKKTIAIIIAIEDYYPNNNIQKVKYAKDDALKFKEVLMNKMKVAEEDINMYINEDALKNNLEYDLQGFVYSLTEDDRLIFYYAGHGFHDGVSNYLSTYDMHKSNISETAVSLRKILLDPLQKSKCRNALIFIDACAQNLKNEHERNLIYDINDNELVLLNSNLPNYAIFLSCQSGQSSYSCDNLKNGIWTYHLIKALNENEIKNKYITDRLLSNYLSDIVPKYAKEKLNYNQNPKSILDSSYENVIIEII